MSEANVIFTLEGSDLTIQCSKTDKMKDICQRYAIKAEKNINTLIFLYGGNQLNPELTFEAQATSIDKERKIMQVLVYKNEANGFACPKCGEKIQFNTEKIDDIISSINNIKDTIDGAKLIIENIIKISSINLVNVQLKSVSAILITINEDIKKSVEKLNQLLKESLNNINSTKNKNIIKGVLDIKVNEINNSIILFNTDINYEIDVYLNNKKLI